MRLVATLFLAFLMLTLAAHLRPPEYDEAYSIFLTAGDARPAWPQGVFHPDAIRNFYQGSSTPRQIAHDLRIGDVHPPLYFWTLEYWRRLTGPSWFAARMLSVLFSIGALAALAWLATLAEIPVIATLLIALLSYGFAYTGIVARGFACAQCLNLLGIALTYKGSSNQNRAYSFAGGLAFGSAAFSNYLAVFIGLATLVWLLCRAPRQKNWLFTAIGLILFFPAIAYFFFAQRNSRIGQFVVFSPPHAVFLLAKDGGAALFGGLPIYAGHAADLIAAGLAAFILICAGFIIKNWQPKLLLFAFAAFSMPAGLLALGFIFNNTPIEIRYLAFGTPFIAILLAQTLPRKLLYLLLCLEACGFAGLVIAPATMQPQGIAAQRITAVATPASLILLPFGNDGVGIPGPFIAALPGNPRLQLLKSSLLPNLAGERRVILVTITADTASQKMIAQSLTMFNTDPCWVRNSATEFLQIFIQTCAGSLKPN